MLTSKFVLVTTFSSGGFKIYGERFLHTFRATSPDATLLLVVDEDIAELSSAEFSWVNVTWNRYASEIDAFLEVYARTADREPQFEFQADRFVYKPCAIMTAIKFLAGTELGDRSQYLVWLDGDTVFLNPGLLNLLERLTPGEQQIASVLDRKESFYFLEAGLMIFNLAYSETAGYVQDVMDTFLSGRIFSMHEWHDGFLWTVEMYKRPQRKFRLLCRENNWSGRHPIASSRELSRYIDHVKGSSRKFLGFSPERYGLVGMVGLKVLTWLVSCRRLMK